MSGDVESNPAGMFDRTIKPYLLVLAVIFAVSFLAGTFVPPHVRRQMIEMFQTLAGDYRELSGGMLFFSILVQNVMATMFVVIFGVVAGIIPAFAVGSNAFGLGVLFRQASEVSGYPKAVLKVLPYGVFEIPALLVASSYGLWLGVMAVRRWRGKEGTPLKIHMEHAFRRYFAVVFPLLVVAAAIETALILWLP
ncbi:MAG: stage II sporulation protein M [Desulfobacteria bacterium]